MGYSFNNQDDPADVLAKIREIVRNGTIKLTSHCRARMLERSIDFQDLLLILSNGEIKEPPEFSPEHRHWKWKIAGPTLDGDEATAITVVLTGRAVLVITVYA